MAGITLAQAESALAEHLAAQTAVTNNQSYSIEGRSMTRADLAAIRDGITYWNKLVISLSRGGIRVVGATPSNG